MDASRIREGMHVYASDGEKLGRVFTLDQRFFIIERGFFFPRDYLCSYEHVAEVRDDDIVLNRTGAELREADEVAEHGTGPEPGWRESHGSRAAGLSWQALGMGLSGHASAHVEDSPLWHASPINRDEPPSSLLAGEDPGTLSGDEAGMLLDEEPEEPARGGPGSHVTYVAGRGEEDETQRRIESPQGGAGYQEP